MLVSIFEHFGGRVLLPCRHMFMAWVGAMKNQSDSICYDTRKGPLVVSI